MSFMVVTDTDGHQWLTNTDTGDETLWFTMAPRIPVCNLSAPAHDNILLIRVTWYGWHLIRRWKDSFPMFLVMYLLAQLPVSTRCCHVPVLIDCKPVCVVPMVNHKVSSPVSVLVNHCCPSVSVTTMKLMPTKL